MPTSARVLLASPDDLLASEIAQHLDKFNGQGPLCLTCGNDEAFWHHCGNQHLEMVVLDSRLPNFTSTFKTARTWIGGLLCVLGCSFSSEAKLLFEMGTDDYIDCRLPPVIISYKLWSHLRRAQIAQGGDLLADDIRIVPDQFTVYKAGQNIQLSAKEFFILYLMARHPHKVFSIEDIYERVWRSHYSSHRDDNLVQSHISKIRRKLEDNPKRPKYVITMRGHGYTFGPDVRSDPA